MMKQNYLSCVHYRFVVLFAFLVGSFSFLSAQRTVEVDPGFGTLNTAIFGDTTATGERTDTNTVYILKRDGLYLLDGTIENRFPLSIVAEEGSGARPILQPAVGTGGSSSRALTPRSDITLRGLYITNLDEFGGMNTRIIRARGENMRIIIDDCHLDKDGQSAIRVDNDGMKIYITNSIISNIGLMSSPNNGRGIDDRGNPIDSLVVENNDVYNLTSRFLRDDGGLINYAKITNNTFYNLGQGSIHFGEVAWALCQDNLFINTSFLGNATADSPGGMRVDSLTQANIDAGITQCVVISNNNFFNDPAIATAYPDTVKPFKLFNGPALAMMETSGRASSNQFSWVDFANAPNTPTSVVSSYYATLTDPEPNPENMDDGNGGVDTAQVQFPFDFSYLAGPRVILGSSVGGPLGNGNNSATINPMNFPRIVQVDPGFGTLNTAIFSDTTATGERTDTNTVYILKRGGIYLLDGTIENRFPLTIIAEDGEGARPILQPAVGTGGSSSRALTPRSDITLRGLYITNLDEFGGLNTRIIRARGGDMRIIIDDCHLDKDGQSAIRVDNDGMKIYITNSIISNIGLMSSPNNGRGIDDRGNPIDSLVAENNTVYNLTSRFLRDDGGLINYARIVHNTFYNLGQGSIHFGETAELICANNLFINTSFLGKNFDEVVGGMRSDVLSAANDSMGLVQRVNISHNNFYTDSSIPAAYPDTVQAFQLFDTTTQAFIAASGFADTNVGESVTFTTPPAVPSNVVSSYYATLTDTEPNPENMDDGNGGPAIDQVQFPFDFNYSAVAAVAAGGTKGQPMGSLLWQAVVSVGIDDDLADPKEVQLINYPNPFSLVTTFAYQLKERSRVSLHIFDASGKRLRTLVDGVQQAGKQTVSWEAGDIPNGVYFYRLQLNDNILTKKLVLMKN